MLLSEFIHAVKKSVYPRTKICNKVGQSNTRGDILNAVDNADDEEIFGFSELFYKIAPTNIDEYTKNRLLNMQQDNVRPQRNIDINDKLTDERYQKNKIDDKASYGKNLNSKIDEEDIIEYKDIIILKFLSKELKKIDKKE